MLFSKKKINYFLYTHVLLILGVLFLDLSWSAMLISLLAHVMVLSPILALTVHYRFNHNYIEFKNSTLEWLGLLLIAVYSFWKFTDVKSYHVYHHQKWLSSEDPTGSEIGQGKIKYYLGMTDPKSIPVIESAHDPKVDWINRHFYLIKFVVYVTIIVLLGINAFFYMIILQQFYFYVFEKMHDLLFHWSVTARDKPWLFPLYFNSSWHIEHHKNYREPDQWHWPLINTHYWFYKLLFK
jgi:hypothetical protein